MSDLAAAERERDEAINNFEETYADLAQARYELKQARSDLATEQAALAASQQRAPGGNETWARFDRDAEAFLRWGEVLRHDEPSPGRPTPHLDRLKAELASTYRSWAASVREYEVERHNRLAAEREQNNAVAELGSARQELQALRARDEMSRSTWRLFHEALGIDPEGRSVMEARRIRAELDELREQAGGGPG